MKILYKFKKNILTFTTLLFAVSSINAANYKVDLIKSDVNNIELKINFDAPQIIKDKNGSYAYYKKSNLVVNESYNLVPQIIKFISLTDKNPRVTIINQESAVITVNDYLTFSSDTIKTVNTKSKVSVKYSGMYKKTPLYVLTVYPISVNPNGSSISYLKNIHIRINSSVKNELSNSIKKIKSDNFTKELFINGSNVYSKEPIIKSKIQPITKSSINTNTNLTNNEEIYKIGVNEDGIYKITYEDLDKAGFPVDKVDVKKIQLFNLGKEIPIYISGAEDGVFNEGDYIDFWGVKNEKTVIDKYPDLYSDPFSDINVYWLVNGSNNGRRLVDESGGIHNTSNNVFTPDAYEEKIHFEKNSRFVRFGDESAGLNKPSYEMDHWFYDSGISAISSKLYECYLPYPSNLGQNVFVKAMFRGESIEKSPYNNLIGHQVSLWLNSEKIGEVLPYEKWKDQKIHTISNEGAIGLPQANLKHGINELRVNMEQDGVTDIVLLNWFNVTYMRRYRADNNFIKFKLSPSFPENYTIQYEIDGFSTKDIQIYKLGVSKIINGMVNYFTDVDEHFNSYRLIIQDEVIDPNIEYVAVTEAGKKKPVYIHKMESWYEDYPEKRITDVSNSANYLIITTSILFDEAFRLKTLKEKDGLKAEIVKVENIYDEFNNGIKSPLAIKKFLKYALNNWDKDYPLEYVVFVGDASYNYKDKYDLVPTLMFETIKYGASASDYLYSLLSGDDDIPDVVVARIPADTNEKLSFYIDKIKNYQENPEISEWANNALFISGNDATVKEAFTKLPIFRSQNLRLINMKLPDPIFGYRLNSVKSGENYDPDFGGTTDLIEYFDNGVSYINFLGHGGGGIWADVSLMNLSDVDRLNNGNRLPFISSMTCYTGAFENPGRDGLAERLVLAQNKGAIGMIASSSVGWIYNDFAVEWGLIDFLWEEGITMGQAVNLMKIYYLNNPLYYYDDGSFSTFDYNILKKSMINQYNYFGDPAIEMHKIKNTLKVTIDNQTPAAGDSVNIKITGGISAGSGHIEITNHEAHRLLNTVFGYNGESIIPFVIPDSIGGNSLYVKVYVGNGIEDASGFAEIGVEKSILQEVAVIPEDPHVGEGISFKVKLKSHFAIDDMVIKNFFYIDEKNKVHSVHVTVNMKQISDSLYESVNEFPGFATPGLKYFDVIVHDNKGDEYRYRWHNIYVKDDRPNLAIVKESERYGGSEKLKFEFKVKNETEQALDSVRIVCYQLKDSDSLLFSDSSYSFLGGEEKRIRVDFKNNIYEIQRKFAVIVDPQNKITERDKLDNISNVILDTDHFFVSKDYGTSLDGINNDTLVIDNTWRFYIAPKSLTASTVIALKIKNLSEYLEKSNQKDMIFVPLVGQQDTTALDVKILNQSCKFNNPAMLNCLMDTDDSRHISSYEYNMPMGMWVKKASPKGFKISTPIKESGFIAVYRFEDEKKPIIEVTTNGRPLANDMMIPEKPNIALLLQDENGINFKSSFNFRIDGEKLADDDIAMPDTLNNPNYISVIASPVLNSGEHTLSVSVDDVNGNHNEKIVKFSVSNDFQIQVFGNFPNPFKEETIISYNIINNITIDDISIKIYSVSGRLVRSKPLMLDEKIGTDHDIKTLGYHEVIWDGTDDDNVPVANGIYFLIFTGKYKDKTIKTTLKVAKLR
jgi:hypothetical protein